MLTVGDKLPTFSLQAAVSIEEGREFEVLTDRSHAGRWQVLFFWPMDFTFICPTEIAEFGRRHRDFVDRDAIVLGASTDTHFVHLAWRKQHPDLRALPFPMLADTKRELSSALGILHEQDGGGRGAPPRRRHSSLSGCRRASLRAAPMHLHHCGEASFSPMMPSTIRPRLSSRPGLAGSPSNTMPRMAVPIAPTPTHTA